MLTVSDVANRLGVSAATVRNYSKEFGDHLSSGATPTPGQPRRFSEDDLRVMATAKQLLDEGATYEQVRDRLAQGIHLVEVEPPPPPEPEPQETALVPLASVRLIVEPYVQERDRVLAERDELLQEVRELREEVGHLRGQLEAQQRQGKSWLQRLLGR